MKQDQQPKRNKLITGVVGAALALSAAVLLWQQAGNTVVSKINSGSSQISGIEETRANRPPPPIAQPPALPRADDLAQRTRPAEAPAATAAPEPERGRAPARRAGSERGSGGSPGFANLDGLTGGVQARAPAPRPHATTTAIAPTPAVPQGMGFNTAGTVAGPGSPVDSVAALPTIDPNGRFATTYRPGRGYMSGFEAALARGDIPGEARELVADVGGRYAPEMPAPTDKALTWRVDLERAALPPDGGHTHVRIAIRSSATPATARPPMSVHVVLDVSNSMAGASIENARSAAQALVGRLQPNDHFSLTAFGGTASVRVPEGAVGPRRQQILDTIAGLQLEGGTNISAGLELGFAEAARGPQAPEWVKLVMLLSDGRPNAGETRADALAAMAARAFQSGVQTSSFGVGEDYDGPLMNGIAEQGAGGYYYVRDSAGIASALATELESRLQPVAQAVEVRVRLRPDVRLTQTYGSRRLDAAESAAVRAQEVAVDEQTARRDRIVRDRQTDIEGGMRFFIPGFARDDRHVILLGLDLPAGVGTRPLATVELRYKDRLTRRNVVDELPVRVRYADSAAASAATADASVQRTVQGFDAGEALLQAARHLGAGNNAAASAALAERVSLLRAASAALHEPRLAEDANRLERLRNLVGGGGALSQPLVLALLLNTSGQGMLH